MRVGDVTIEASWRSNGARPDAGGWAIVMQGMVPRPHVCACTCTSTSNQGTGSLLCKGRSPSADKMSISSTSRRLFAFSSRSPWLTPAPCATLGPRAASAVTAWYLTSIRGDADYSSYSCSKPLDIQWQTTGLEKPDCTWALNAYSPRLQTFLRAMEAEEKRMKSDRLDNGSEPGQLISAEHTTVPLSQRMRQSWDSKTWLVNYAANGTFAFDYIWWEFLDKEYFGENPDGDHRGRLDVLSAEQREAMERFVDRKLKGEDTTDLWDEIIG